MVRFWRSQGIPVIAHASWHSLQIVHASGGVVGVGGGQVLSLHRMTLLVRRRHWLEILALLVCDFDETADIFCFGLRRGRPA